MPTTTINERLANLFSENPSPDSYFDFAIPTIYGLYHFKLCRGDKTRVYGIHGRFETSEWNHYWDSECGENQVVNELCALLASIKLH
jgi:hypothetical protein